jgi:uncharacterized protein YycO
LKINTANFFRFAKWYHILILIATIIIAIKPFEQVKFDESNDQKKNINPEFQNGDIIFQSSVSEQSEAIKLATHSPYNHCGIIYVGNDSIFVLEAVQPVKITPIDKFISRNEFHHYVVKRLLNSDSLLNAGIIDKIKEEGNKMLLKNYDIYFEWTDERMYCSELIWKIYKRAAGIELGKLQKLRDFDLSSQAVKAIIKQRYGRNPPLDEYVISPQAIFDSHLLKTVAYQ